MVTKQALEKAGQAWCTPKTKHLVMQPEVAEAFAEILDAAWNEAWHKGVSGRYMDGSLVPAKPFVQSE